MAVLKSTSPGQLGKYVVPTIEIIKSGSVSTATKTYRLKKGEFNNNAIKKFAELGMKGSSFQKDALMIPLETTDNKKKYIEIGSLNKPNVKYNLGDMAEGVVGAAITARFIYKNKNINAQIVYGVLSALAKSGPTNYPGKKGKQVEKTFKSANKNPKIMDDVRCFISLAEVNMLALLSPNKIEVLSDGLGEQRTTKVDVSVKITNDKGESLPVDILVSLKAGDVKQFGQVSGAEFEKQEEFWERLFGYGDIIKPLKTRYESLMFTEKKPTEAVYLVYEKVNQRLNQDMRGAKSDELMQKLSSAINYFATLNEQFVTLVQVGGGRTKVYQFDDIYEKLRDKEYSSNLKTGASGLPTVVISSGREDLIQFRVKQEFKSDGSPYIRNYVEKLSLLGDLLAESL